MHRNVLRPKACCLLIPNCDLIVMNRHCWRYHHMLHRWCRQSISLFHDFSGLSLLIKFKMLNHCVTFESCAYHTEQKLCLFSSKFNFKFNNCSTQVANKFLTKLKLTFAIQFCVYSEATMFRRNLKWKPCQQLEMLLISWFLTNSTWI